MSCEQIHINHVEYEKKVRGMTLAELGYTIRDCKAAIAAMPEGYKAGYYADEVNYCVNELHRRKSPTNKEYNKVMGTVKTLVDLLQEKDPESLGTKGGELIIAEVEQALKSLMNCH